MARRENAPGHARKCLNKNLKWALNSTNNKEEPEKLPQSENRILRESD